MAHKGERKTRSARPERIPKLGRYVIVTDTDETEKNYFEGLKANLPEASRNQLEIVVRKCTTQELVKKACEEMLRAPKYAQIVIVFDCDDVRNFDTIIRDAEKQDIFVGWSNPCFEIWMHAYFGEMPPSDVSKTCIAKFSRSFMERSGGEYAKSDKRIYEKLTRYGNEETAIKIAKNRYQSYKGTAKPSEMNPCTAVWQIVEEIKNKSE